MSAILRDSYLESMDPISRMVEPFVSPIFEVAKHFKNKYVIPFDDVKRMVLKELQLNAWKNDEMPLADALNCKYFYAADMLYRFVNESNHINLLDSVHLSYYLENWNIELSSSIEFDLKNSDNASYDDVVLSFDENCLKPDAIKLKFSQYMRRKITTSNPNKEQIKTVVNSISLNPSLLKGRTYNVVNNLADEVCDLVLQDKWRIRSSVVMMEIANAIYSVLDCHQGWGEDLANLVHLKIMTHNNAPIYTFTKVKT